MNLRPCIAGPGITLAQAKAFAPNFVDAESLPERTTSIDLGVSGPIGNWRTDFLFEYDIFPSWIMRFEAEWATKERRMSIGDVIVQRAILPPVGFGICLEFAVRVCSIIKEEGRIGFAYETLAGHAERGRSEFYFEEKGELILFTIRTLSEPGHWTSQCAEKVFTLPYQAWCTRRALDHVRRRFQQMNRI